MPLVSFKLRFLLAALLPLAACSTADLPVEGQDSEPIGELGQDLTDGADHDLSGTPRCDEKSGCPVDLPVVKPVVYRFWGASANDVWAVGKDALTMHWNGTMWGRFSNPAGTNLRAAWGSASNDVWAVGDNATIVHWDGTKWSKTTGLPTTYGFNDVWGTAANDVWAVGDNGTILRWNGMSWSQISAPYANSFTTVWGAVSTSVWMAGEAGMLLRWDGTKLNEVASGVVDTILSIRGSSVNRVYFSIDGAPGANLLRKWDGMKWTPLMSTGGAIWAVSDTNVWTCTSYTPTGMSVGVCYHWDGFDWLPYSGFPVSPQIATGLWATDTDGWYCNDAGRMARYNGTKWVTSW